MKWMKYLLISEMAHLRELKLQMKKRKALYIKKWT